MQVAALYDIHGNLPALEAVLADVDAGVIVVGGDFASGAWPSETLERLRGLGDRVVWIRGNADRELLQPQEPREGYAPLEVVEWVRARMSADELEFLSGLPLTQTLDVDGLGEVLFCHATPRNDEDILTRDSPDDRWRSALGELREHIVVCGHTHVQFDRTIGKVRIVNAGSVGMPYEDEPGAYWAELGPEVSFRRTTYDVAETLNAITAAGWPDEWPAASADEATEYFERLSRERA